MQFAATAAAAARTSTLSERRGEEIAAAAATTKTVGQTGESTPLVTLDVDDDVENWDQALLPKMIEID